jgi:IS5 family transposase
MQRSSGHNAPPDHKFKVYSTGQKRRVTPQLKREFKRRAAIEPVIGPLKEYHRTGRNHLANASGNAINAVLAAAGYNFRRLLASSSPLNHSLYKFAHPMGYSPLRPVRRPNGDSTLRARPVR